MCTHKPDYHLIQTQSEQLGRGHRRFNLTGVTMQDFHLDQGDKGREELVISTLFVIKGMFEGTCFKTRHPSLWLKGVKKGLLVVG